MIENKYVLAMYDVRGKQDYIYRRNKLKEIVGASLIIRDCFLDYLFPMASAVAGKGIYSYRVTNENGKYKYKDLSQSDEVEEFSKSDLENKFNNEGYIGYVVYDGGGNFFVIYKSLDIYRKVNKLFYIELLKETSSLKILSTYVEGLDFENYLEDEKKLRAHHETAERAECAIYPVNSLPIVQVDYSSSMPLTDIIKLPDDNKLKDEKVSKESKAKYDKFNFYDDPKKEEIKILDDLVEKGEDSHIAVIYIDGNSMGAKVQKCLSNSKKTYEACINALRKFSNDIQKKYIDIPMKKITEVLTDEDAKKLFRFVVYAGDEITFICNAKMAYKVVKAYFDSLDFDAGESSCAGIAVFHSHAPYSDAYRIAEECCESGKKLMKAKEMDNACFVDFHYCQGAIGTSLEEIRKNEGTEEACTPWLIKGKADDSMTSIEKIEKMEDILGKIARSNNKTLLQVSKKSQEAFDQEIERIITHYRSDNKESQKDKLFLLENKQFILGNKDLIYRMMMVYDLWFRKLEH